MTEMTTPLQSCGPEVSSSRLTKQERIDRCKKEIAEINGNGPNWMNALGEADWRAEIALIEEELDDYADKTKC